MKLQKELTLDEALIQHENSKLMNPILGGIRSVYPLFTDDHKKHILSHLKFFYNPYTWIHIFEHFKMHKHKKDVGLDFLTNNVIMEAIKAQQVLNAVEKEMTEMPSKDTKWN